MRLFCHTKNFYVKNYSPPQFFFFINIYLAKTVSLLSRRVSRTYIRKRSRLIYKCEMDFTEFIAAIICLRIFERGTHWLHLEEEEEDSRVEIAEAMCDLSRAERTLPIGTTPQKHLTSGLNFFEPKKKKIIKNIKKFKNMEKKLSDN